jgi:hypothetical protein
MGYFVGVFVSVLYCSIDFVVRNIIAIDIDFWMVIDWMVIVSGTRIERHELILD